MLCLVSSLGAKSVARSALSFYIFHSVFEITIKFVERLKGIVIVICATHLMDRNEVLIDIVLQELSVVL